MPRHCLMVKYRSVLSALESSLPGHTNQSREAHAVKLAPWMGLKG